MRRRARPDLWEPGEGNLPRPPDLRPQEIAPKNISLCDVVIDSGDVDKRASVDEITVSQNSCGYTVKPGGKAELTANNTIRILPGFHAERGSRFHAQLAYCGTTAE